MHTLFTFKAISFFVFFVTLRHKYSYLRDEISNKRRNKWLRK